MQAIFAGFFQILLTAAHSRFLMRLQLDVVLSSTIIVPLIVGAGSVIALTHSSLISGGLNTTLLAR